MLLGVQDNVCIEEVKLRRKYINSGDVFILDLGLKIIQVYCVLCTVLNSCLLHLVVMYTYTHMKLHYFIIVEW